MLINEAKWLGQKILKLSQSHDLFPMLNLGSSSAKLREVNQPWIQAYIFKRLGNQKVIHVDITAGEGVDLVGDLTGKKFQKKLRGMSFKSVLCTNLFEHIPNKEELAKLIVEILPVGGYIFVSCPFRYPYHPCPIDTGFRPSIDELAALFPKTKIIDAKIVPCLTCLGYIKHSPFSLIKIVNLQFWYSAVSHLFFLWRRFEVTCLVLVKKR